MLLRILLAIDSAPLRRKLARLLPRDALVSEAPRDGGLWADVGKESVDVVLTTRAIVSGSERGAIQTVRALPDGPEVIVLTDENDPEVRAGLMAAGALAVVDQDLPEEVLREVLSVLTQRQREAIVAGVRARQTEPTSRFSDFVSSSLSMQRLIATARRVSSADSSLLILGETGVGKEWLARAVHRESPRARSPFIAVNCAALPAGLLESELFGHEKGAFTGAHRARRGYFEQAHGGTVFLDEVGEMEPILQAKLLRVLQGLTIQRLGSEKEMSVDVRVLAASNRDLEAAMAQGDFRKDLYYRLGVLTLTVPPLRERKEDIPALVSSHFDHFRVHLRRPVTGIDPAAMAALVRYDWPGNVRELINVVERAVLLCRGATLVPEDLPDGVLGAAAASGRAGALPDPERAEAMSFKEARERSLDAFERTYLMQVLRASGGRVGVAAGRAGISPRTLFGKMKRLGLRKEDYR